MGTAPRAPDVVDGPHVSATCCLRRIHFTDSPFTLSSASTMTVTASTLPEPQFKHYDRDLIRDDLEQRVTFARDFLRFTEDDGKLLNSVAPLIAPLPQEERRLRGQRARRRPLAAQPRRPADLAPQEDPLGLRRQALHVRL